MSKLTKKQAKAHAQAVALLQKDELTFDERWFVLENWQESANHVNSEAGAFFTPIGLAHDFSLEVGGGRIIDLCAGIGGLAFHAYNRASWNPSNPPQIVCVEKNPDYVAIGRKILPEALWICADVFDLPADLGRFDVAIGNPPFGATPRQGAGPRYTGRAFEYHVIDIAADLAERGVFIVPQNSAPFRYSGVQCFTVARTDDCEAFELATGVELSPNCGIDTETYRHEWRGTSPRVEIVLADFQGVKEARKAVPRPVAAPVTVSAAQLDLFAVEA